MSDLTNDLVAAQTAVNAAVAADASAAPTLADNVLAAVLPVLEADGWAAPAPLNTTTDTTPVDVNAS